MKAPIHVLFEKLKSVLGQVSETHMFYYIGSVVVVRVGKYTFCGVTFVGLAAVMYCPLLHWVCMEHFILFLKF